MGKEINNLSKSLEESLDLSSYSEKDHNHDDEYDLINHGSHLELGVESDKAFRGDYGNFAYVHSIMPHAPSNAQKNSDITKEEIEAKLTGNITSHSHDYVNSNDINNISNSIGEMNLLEVNKSNIVDVINEISSNIDDGKQVLVDAIDDESINSNSSFEEIGNAISDIKNGSNIDIERLYQILSNAGLNIPSDYDLNKLLYLLDSVDLKFSDVKQIACGEEHLMILTNDGNLYGAGDNLYGQLGIGVPDDYPIDFVVPYSDDEISTYGMGWDDVDILTNTLNFAVSLDVFSDVESVYCGMSNTYIIKKDGSVWGCGYNSYSQFGNNTMASEVARFVRVPNDNIKHIAASSQFTYFLTNDNSVYCAGRNYNGQLGLGNTTEAFYLTQPTLFKSKTNIKQIAVGFASAYVLENNGDLYSCGINKYGQLGIGDTSTWNSFLLCAQNVSSVVSGENFVYIIKNDGTVWVCGNNDYGQLGFGDVNDRYSFTQLNISNVKNIYCSPFSLQVFALKNDGTLWGCGYNSYGQLGLGDKTNRKIFTQIDLSFLRNGDEIDQVCTSSSFSCIKTKHGFVYCAGRNDYGAFGNGTYNNSNYFTESVTDVFVTGESLPYLK